MKRPIEIGAYFPVLWLFVWRVISDFDLDIMWENAAARVEREVLPRAS